MRTKTVPIKHFRGEVSFEAVKVKYRQLAKQHHPDAGGSTQLFQEILEEFTYIKETSPSYPLGLTNTTSWEDLLNQATDLAARQRRHANQRPLTEEEKWNNLKRGDSKYVIIDDTLEIALRGTKTANWLLMEVYKLEELSLMHFKYIKFMLVREAKIKGNPEFNLSDAWLHKVYSDYCSIWRTKWT